MVWKKLQERKQKSKRHEHTEIRFDLFGWTDSDIKNFSFVSNENCSQNCLWEIENHE